MKLKDAFMQTSVKKAAVLSICVVFFLMFIVQSVFINQVFSIINRNITHFENIFEEDDLDLNNDLREINEEKVYDKQLFAHTSDQLNLSSHATPQEKGCFYEKSIKRFEAMKSLAYVQHSEFARIHVERELYESRNAIKASIEKHEFDPALCAQAVL